MVEEAGCGGGERVRGRKAGTHGGQHMVVTRLLSNDTAGDGY